MCGGGTQSSRTSNIIIKGKGTVIFDVPAGVNYLAKTQDLVVHEGFFYMFGGKSVLKTAGNPETIAYERGSLPATWDTFEPSKFIYKEVPNPIPATDSDYNVTDKSGNVTWDGIGKLNKEYIKNSGLLSKLRVNSRGEVIYPSTNIYMVSVDENASFDFYAMDNLYTGFIYAPYMTFNAHGDGGNMRMIGGLIVSDYRINSSNRFYYLKPQIPIDQLMPSDIKFLTPKYERSWRVRGY